MKIITTIQNHIAAITLNNPDKSNALDVDMRDALIEAYINLDKNPDVQIIILNGNGKHFCAGADLHHMHRMTTVSDEENLNDAKQFAQLFYTIYSCEKPTICCAHGKIVGGGLGLLAASDIAIAASDATFCFSEVKLGLIPAVISPFIIQRIHYQSAKYHMMIAELFDAQKALKMGLIDHIDTNALSISESLLKNSVVAMQALKKWLRALRPIAVEQIDQAAIQLAKIRSNSEAKNKIKTFLTHQRPEIP